MGDGKKSDVLEARGKTGARKAGAPLVSGRTRVKPKRGPASERLMRAEFLRRMRALSRDLARNAPSDVLADALSRPSARGAITHVLREVEPSAKELEAARLRERAMERGLAMRERLRDDAGGFLDTAQVAARLGVRRQSVDKRRKEGGLLALETPQGYLFPTCQFTIDGTVPGLKDVDKRRKEGGLLALETPQGYLFPTCQFTIDGTVPGLKDVLAGMKEVSFWETLAGLVTPAPALGGHSILVALEQCRGDEERRRITELTGAARGRLPPK